MPYPHEEEEDDEEEEDEEEEDDPEQVHPYKYPAVMYSVSENIACIVWLRRACCGISGRRKDSPRGILLGDR